MAVAITRSGDFRLDMEGVDLITDLTMDLTMGLITLDLIIAVVAIAVAEAGDIIAVVVSAHHNRFPAVTLI